MAVKEVLSETFMGGAGTVSSGMFNFKQLGSDSCVEKIKNVISKNPRSTMGVRSTLVDSFLFLRMPAIGRSAEAVFISAITVYLSTEMRWHNFSILSIRQPRDQYH